MRWWIIPTIFAAVRAMFILHHAAFVPISGPNADAGAMSWIGVAFIDFPTGLLSLLLIDVATPNLLAVSIVLLLGAAHWFLIGLIVVWLFNVGKRVASELRQE